MICTDECDEDEDIISYQRKGNTMYTYDQRMKAVKLFIESNINENIVIKNLGYPSPGALRSWYKEYMCNNDLRKESKGKPRFTQ